MMPSRRRQLFAAIVVAAGAAAIASPATAQAAVHIPGAGIGIPNPFDLGLPGPTDLIGKVFEFFFKTFFGIEATVTQRTVEWLLAAPVYSDTRAYADLNQLRSDIDAAAWALFALVFTVSAIRYYASGFTSAGSYEAVESLARGGVAAGALAVYPQVFGALTITANYLTYGVIHDPTVGSGLTKVLAGATVSSFTPLGVGTIAAVVAVVIFLLLIVTKIVLSTLLALLFVAAPLAIALWPLPETSWLARTVLQSLLGVLLWPVVWALCFALFAVIGASAFAPGGSFGSHIVKPWVSVAALYVSFKAPQLLARQAMLAGLMPSPGAAMARGLMYGRAALGSRGAEGVSGRFASSASAGQVRDAPPDLQAPRGQAAPRRVLTRPMGADHRRGDRGRTVRRLPLAAAHAGDDLRVDRRRRTAGRPLVRSDGLGVLRCAVRPCGVAVLAPASALSAWRWPSDARLHRPGRTRERQCAGGCPSRRPGGAAVGRLSRTPHASAHGEAGDLCPVEAIDREGLVVTSEGALVRFLRAAPKNPLVMSSAEREQVGHAFGQLAGRLQVGQSLQFYVEAAPVRLDALLAHSERGSRARDRRPRLER